MNPLESFTLRPSSAFSSYDDNVASKENQFRPIPAAASMITGTIRQDWSGGRPRPVVDPEAGLGIRASPFEPLIQDRNLPKCGTISPLSSEEYRAWIHARSSSPSSQTAATQDTATSSRILLPKECNIVVEDDDDDENSWKLRYLQSEMERTKTRMSMLALMEEKRQMRIRLLTLEAMLNTKRSHCTYSAPDDAADEMNESIASEADNQVSNDTPDAAVGDPSNQVPSVESKETVFLAQDDDGSKAEMCQEALNYVNTTRGGHVSTSMESESLPDVFQLDSERFSSSLDTTLSEIEQASLDAGAAESVHEQGSDLEGTTAANESSAEPDDMASVADNPLADARDADDPIVLAPEPIPDTRITRSCVRKNDPEPASSSKPDKEVTLVSSETVSTETMGRKDDLVEIEGGTVEALISDEQIEKKASPKKKGKRKRTMNSDLLTSFQAPALKKRTRRRT